MKRDGKTSHMSTWSVRAERERKNATSKERKRLTNFQKIDGNGKKIQKLFLS